MAAVRRLYEHAEADADLTRAYRGSIGWRLSGAQQVGSHPPLTVPAKAIVGETIAERMASARAYLKSRGVEIGREGKQYTDYADKITDIKPRAPRSKAEENHLARCRKYRSTPRGRVACRLGEAKRAAKNATTARGRERAAERVSRLERDLLAMDSAS